jgi:hypothetical protein
MTGAHCIAVRLFSMGYVSSGPRIFYLLLLVCLLQGKAGRKQDTVPTSPC